MGKPKKAIYYDIFDIVKVDGKDILKSSNFRNSDLYIQHGSMSVAKHCINVARYSLFFSKKLGIQCNRDELIRGALLHDYFLYDWHDKENRNPLRLHGLYHPYIASRNAQKEYNLTIREKDIIEKHMWPLTIVPPMCKEAWIVTFADKYCSLMETIHLHKGKNIPIKVRNEDTRYFKSIRKLAEEKVYGRAI